MMRVLHSPSDAQRDVPLGIYIHIPFCLQRCHDCYYLSYAGQSPRTIDRYLNALRREVAIYGQFPALAGRRPAFVYIGGGTPSLLSARQIESMVRGITAVFPWEQAREITFECAPQSVTYEQLKALRAAGVSRISQLEIPRNTRLYRTLRDGCALVVPTWEEKRARVRWAFAKLEEAGYAVRSAYAAVRDPCRHAFIYQDAQYRGADVIGLGVASCSYFQGVHYQNVAKLNTYATCCAVGRLPSERAYALSDEERLVREFVLQLKLGRLNVQYFRDQFGVDVCRRFVKPLERFAALRWLTFDPHSIGLTRDDLLQADRTLPEFYLPEHSKMAYW